MTQLPKKYKVLKVISLIFGIGLLLVNGMKLVVMLITLMLRDSLTEFDFLYSSYIFGLVPAFFLLRAAKIKDLSLGMMMLRYQKTASIVLLCLIFFPISRMIRLGVSFNTAPFNFFEYFAHFIEVIQLLIFPIFFFIFKKKLPEVSSESMENGLLDSEEIL
jgi:hypothetical protein